MAKNKDVEIEADEILADIENRLDCECMIWDEIVPIARTSTGIPGFNPIMGGGYPHGRVVEIYSRENIGKTSLALEGCSEVQKQFLAAKEAGLPLLSPDCPDGVGRAAFIDILPDIIAVANFQ